MLLSHYVAFGVRAIQPECDGLVWHPLSFVTLSHLWKKNGGMVQGAYVSPGHTQLAELAQQQANDIAFDPSAISILDEAVTLGVLPAIKYVFCVPAAKPLICFSA